MGVEGREKGSVVNNILMQCRYVFLLLVPIVSKKSRYFVLLSDFSLVCFYMRYVFSTKATSFARLAKH